MPNRVAATGYTNVILVLNMKRFVPEDAKERFEALRGTDDLARLIKTQWASALKNHPYFVPLDAWKQRQKGEKWRATVDQMDTENIGLATGVFRSVMLARFVTPTYALDKSKISFDEALETNFQFRNLFRKVFDRWDIYVRPTMTGFFTIRLTYHYKARNLIDLARDAHRLQEPFDIPSAANWYHRNKERYANDPETLSIKQRSIQHLLAWLGADPEDPKSTDVHYYPVQWKLALEVINWFVGEANLPLSTAADAPVLQPAQRNLSIPLHDSYIIYHFDQLLAHPSLIRVRKKNKKSGEIHIVPKDINAPANAKEMIQLNSLRISPRLRNYLTAFLEGSILRPDDPENDGKEPVENDQETNEFFPAPRWSRADKLLEENLASWSDELCLLTGRTALFIPAKRWKEHQLAVTTMPGSTLQVRYARYWGALERMVEFILETRVLAQLIESESFRLLEDMAHTVERIREQMFAGDIKIDEALMRDVIHAAHLRRMASLAQSMSHPQFWSRAEYAIAKAEVLLERLGIPQIFHHIHQNIESINNVADHIDELYLADLAEESNDKSLLLSIALGGASVIFTLLVLPSFWADLFTWSDHEKHFVQPYHALVGWVLTAVTLTVITAAFLFVVWLVVKRRHDVKEIIRKLLNGKSAQRLRKHL